MYKLLFEHWLGAATNGQFGDHWLHLDSHISFVWNTVIVMQQVRIPPLLCCVAYIYGPAAEGIDFIISVQITHHIDFNHGRGIHYGTHQA